MIEWLELFIARGETQGRHTACPYKTFEGEGGGGRWAGAQRTAVVSGSWHETTCGGVDTVG